VATATLMHQVPGTGYVHFCVKDELHPLFKTSFQAQHWPCL